MKVTFTLVLLLGLIVIGTAGMARIRTQIRAASIISWISHCRGPDNMAQVQEAEQNVTRRLLQIEHSFVTLMLLGGVVAGLGLTGIIVGGRKRPNSAANNRVHGSLASSAP